MHTKCCFVFLWSVSTARLRICRFNNQGRRKARSELCSTPWHYPVP